MKTKDPLKVEPAGEREILMTRDFDAPRDLVFDAWTKPELLQRWLLGPAGWSMPVCEIDLKVGGAYRYGWRRDSDGHEMGMGGVYCEIVRPKRLVQTELFDEPWYPGEALITTILTEKGDRTTCTSTMLYESRKTRDGILDSGMHSGVAVSYDRLDEVLASMKKGSVDSRL